MAVSVSAPFLPPWRGLHAEPLINNRPQRATSPQVVEAASLESHTSSRALAIELHRHYKPDVEDSPSTPRKFHGEFTVHRSPFPCPRFIESWPEGLESRALTSSMTLGSDGTEGRLAPKPRTSGSLSVYSGSSYRTEGLCRSLAKMPVGTSSRLDAIFANVSATSLSCLGIWLSLRPLNLSSNYRTS